MNIYILLLTFGVFIASFSQILLKKSSSLNHSSIFREYWNIRVITAYSLLTTSLFINIIALKHGVLVKEMPIIDALGYFFVPIFSYFFLNEKYAIRQILAILMIIIGILIFYL